MSNIEWKRVKDELPPLDEVVLLQMRNGDMCVGNRINCYKFYINDWDRPLDQVYAWTYLPKPCTIKNDYNTKFFSPEQFLGCVCDVLIELDNAKLYLDDLEKCGSTALDIVFAKLYQDNIIADFHIEFTFECLYNSLYKDMYKDIFVTRRKQTPYVHYETQINKKTYKEKYREFLLKNIDTKVEEKIKTYLKEYFIDRKGEELI